MFDVFLSPIFHLPSFISLLLEELRAQKFCSSFLSFFSCKLVSISFADDQYKFQL